MTTNEPAAGSQVSRGRLDWRLGATLVALGALGVLAILPMVASLYAAQLEADGVPLALVPVQSLVLLALAVLAGLTLGQRVGLGAPLLAQLVNRGQWRPHLRPLPVAAALGAVGALVIVAIDLGVFAALIGETAATDASVEIPLWRGLLASFYGGITEELLLRFGVMSALVWMTTRLVRRDNARPALMWSSIMVVAVLFGLGHLPATAAITPITPVLVVRAVLLNGTVGVLFGYLFWKRGLEAAIVSHFSADVVLQSAAALVATTGAI